MARFAVYPTWRIQLWKPWSHLLQILAFMRRKNWLLVTYWVSGYPDKQVVDLREHFFGYHPQGSSIVVFPLDNGERAREPTSSSLMNSERWHEPQARQSTHARRAAAIRSGRERARARALGRVQSRGPQAGPRTAGGRLATKVHGIGPHAARPACPKKRGGPGGPPRTLASGDGVGPKAHPLPGG
jgi:hypothetical protein